MNTDDIPNHVRQRMSWSPLMLRLGVGIVFAMWTIDKFVNPDHAAGIFEKFYMVPSLSHTLAYVLGAAQAIVVIAFIAGAFRTFSYGIILALHAVSTFSSYARYFDPWTSPNLLFFAAVPMLAACVTLWLIRDEDMFSVDAWRSARTPRSERSV